MNKVHASLIRHLRDNADVDHQMQKLLREKTDEQIVRLMFFNYRGRDQLARGMRLTNLGVQIMTTFFHGYEIERRDQPELAPLELVYLDRKAKLPYHIGEAGKLVMFDPELGIKLKLADGDVGTLMRLDEYAR
jgi:hypothetical protein